MAPGLGGVCALLLLATGLGILPSAGRRFSYSMFALIALLSLIGVHLFITSLWFAPEYERAALSAILLSLSLLGAVVIIRPVFNDPAALELSLFWMTVIFGLIAVVGLLGVAPESLLASERPLFPFTEPSHYALTAMPFIAFVCMRLQGLARYALLIAVAVLAALLPSLSLVVGLIILIVLLVPTVYAATLLFVGLLSLQYVDLEYFSKRVDLSQETTNLSALAYRQGWELAEKSIDITDGVGVGFQQLGIAPVYTPTSDVIFRLLRQDGSLQDGSFVAAKIIAEFGIFGLIIGIIYLYIAFKAVLFLRKGNKKYFDTARIFSACVIVSYTLEFFVRGIGYFSPTTVLLFAAILYFKASSSPLGEKHGQLFGGTGG